MKENGVQENVVPLSQRFLMRVVNVYVVQASLYSHCLLGRELVYIYVMNEIW